MGGARHLLATTPVVLLCLCAACPAVASGLGGSMIPQQRLTDVEVTTSLSYDSNFPRIGPDLASREGLRLADETFTPAILVTLARPIGPAMLFLKGNGGYDFHRVNTVRNYARYEVDGGGGRRFGECEGAVTGTYSQGQTDLALLVNGGTGRAILKNTLTQENVSFSSTCGRSIGLAPSLSVTQSWSSNSEATQRNIDNQAFVVNAGLGYQAPGFGVASIFGVYQSAGYPNRAYSNLLSGSYGYTMYAGGLRYERHIGVRLDAALSGSYTSLVSKTQLLVGGVPYFAPTSTNFGGLTFSGDVSYRLTSRLLFHVNASRATMPSNRSDADYSVNESYQADATYRLGTRISIRIQADNRGESYHGIVPVKNAIYTNITKSSTSEVIASANYVMSRRLSFMLSVGDAERRASPSAFSYSSTTVGLTARATF